VKWGGRDCRGDKSNQEMDTKLNRIEFNKRNLLNIYIVRIYLHIMLSTQMTTLASIASLAKLSAKGLGMSF
jgi:hypothetical protein